MAVIRSTLAPILTMDPWVEGSGQIFSEAPFGELIAQVNPSTTNVTLSGAGDTQEVICNVVLPPNFVYVLADLSVNIQVLGAPALNTWDDFNYLTYVGTTAGGDARVWGIGWENVSGSAVAAHTTAGSKIYTNGGPLPNWTQAGGGTWHTTFTNANQEEAAATLYFTMRFLVYSIAQRLDARINTPVLIR